jgi:Domain of unknown function (DUF397)
MKWRRSSYSDADGNCVEVRADLGAVRDSKHPDGPVLPASALVALIRAVKTGRVGRDSV